jgi:Zn/Cd-binding protein ZinT
MIEIRAENRICHYVKYLLQIEREEECCHRYLQFAGAAFIPNKEQKFQVAHTLELNETVTLPCSAGVGLSR